MINYANDFSNLLLSSRIHTDALGFFCIREVAVGLASRVIIDADVNKYLSETDDHEKRVSAALGSVTYFHELRHLHDAFGTIGGMGVFFAWLSVARHFVRLVNDLNRSRQEWILPLTSWVKRKDCPSAVREFFHRARVMGSALRMYVGKVDEAIESNDHVDDDEIYKLIPYLDLDFHYPFYDYRWKNGNDVKHVFVPIGLEALIEGNAHAVQRFILENYWPEDVGKDVHNRLYAYLSSDSERIKVRPLPYTITDLLVTRVLKAKGGERYQRSTLMSLTDAALMTSGISLKSRRAENQSGTEISGKIIHPGEQFINILKNLSRTEIEENGASFNTSKEAVTGMRDSMAGGPDPDDIIAVLRSAKTFTLAACVELIDSFVRHKIVVPMLNMRLRDGDQVFRDPLIYLKNFIEFPGPLILVQAGHNRPIDNKSNGLLILWSMYCFLVDAIAQIVNGQTIVHCPRKVSPLFEEMNLAFDGDCSDFLQRNACGYWRKTLQNQLPNCLFRQLIDVTGFDAKYAT